MRPDRETDAEKLGGTFIVLVELLRGTGDAKKLGAKGRYHWPSGIGGLHAASGVPGGKVSTGA